MFNLSDTIAAVCTPPGVGGIAAIRISGIDSWSIIQKIFCSKCETEDHRLTGSLAYKLNHMQALHGFIRDNNKIIDEVIILPFKSPKSFTTEDIVEIFCHGGNKIASVILDLCLKHGARIAGNGEFTFRAFINGRIDLTEVEAIHEIIYADTTRAVYASSEVLAGSLKNKLNDFKQRLLELVTVMESSMEFPMDVSSVEKEDINLQLNLINNEFNELIQNSESGQVIRDGIKVSIVGVPNVGKSSLLNQLLENQRAIVTSEPGTTRDTIEEKVVINGYPFVFIDTAGIRHRKCFSEAEQHGTNRSKDAIENSDIVLFVFDVSRDQNKESEEIYKLIDGKPKIIVGNKVDLIDQEVKADICISAKYGTNIDKLKALLFETTKSIHSHYNNGKKIYVNQRQRELLLQCCSIMSFIVNMISINESEDLIADELKKVISKLNEISGLQVGEDVIANIFAKFCIGK